MLLKSTLLTITFCSCLGLMPSAQEVSDTATAKQLEEIVVTATRTERKLSNIAVPVTVVNQKTIEQSGSLRLNQILQEQAGLYITNNFGSGVQIQGLSPDYVLILIDGEPLIGRNGGVLDLSRITVNNIRQVEIMKGPSSSLYGSEAMGGVINIITGNRKENTFGTNLRYGSNGTVDANVSGSYNFRKFRSSVFVNRNSSKGYDFNPLVIGKTMQPYRNYTGQIKLHYELSEKSRAGVSLRSFSERQDNLYEVGSGVIDGRATIREYNVNPFIKTNFNRNVQSSLRGYFTQYEADTRDYTKSNDSLYYRDYFQQRFYRIENQTDINLSAVNSLVIGSGYSWERLNTNRYSGIRANNIVHAYLQDEHRLGAKFTLIGGIRYDKNAAYASRFSPKLALRLKVTEELSLSASYGAGFKAPDYRQLYLNFTNNTAGGYTVYGANEISVMELQQQQQAGIISNITPFGYELEHLEPEYSNGFNLGAVYRFNSKLSAKVNLFRNDIENLITTKIIAYKPNNAPVFSYFNTNNALTEGIESEAKYQFRKDFRIEIGYQFLITADKDVLHQIEKGQLFGRKEGSLVSEKIMRVDYGGLLDRSKHMANLKLFYEHKQWFANLRALYRSRWGVSDKDGNLVLNRSDEYASGFLMINISGGKTFDNGVQLKAGIDNLTGYKDQTYLSNQPGISFYFTIAYQFLNNRKQKR